MLDLKTESLAIKIVSLNDVNYARLEKVIFIVDIIVGASTIAKFMNYRFHVKSFLTLQFSIGNIAVWGAMAPSPLYPPLSISQRIVFWVSYCC